MPITFTQKDGGKMKITFDDCVVTENCPKIGDFMVEYNLEFEAIFKKSFAVYKRSGKNQR
jgi:hypothetical protein